MKLRNNNTLGKSAKTIALFLGASALSLTSCRDNDFDWNEHYNQNVEHAYAEFIESVFGEVAPDKSWDLSGALNGFVDYGAASQTRAEQNWVTPVKETNTSSFVTLDNNSLEWIQGKLAERERNASLGNPFELVVPDNLDDRTFTLTPIYQGESLCWDFHMVIENGNDRQDITLFKKDGLNNTIGVDGATHNSMGIQVKCLKCGGTHSLGNFYNITNKRNLGEKTKLRADGNHPALDTWSASYKLLDRINYNGDRTQLLYCAGPGMSDNYNYGGFVRVDDNGVSYTLSYDQASLVDCSNGNIKFETHGNNISNYYIFSEEKYEFKKDDNNFSLNLSVVKESANIYTASTVTYKTGGYPFYKEQFEPNVSDNVLAFYSQNNANGVFRCAENIRLNKGKYRITFDSRTDNNKNVKLSVINFWTETKGSENIVKELSFNVGQNYTEKSIDIDVTQGGYYDFRIDLSDFTGHIDIKSIKIERLITEIPKDEDNFKWDFSHTDYELSAMSTKLNNFLNQAKNYNVFATNSTLPVSPDSSYGIECTHCTSAENTWVTIGKYENAQYTSGLRAPKYTITLPNELGAGTRIYFYAVNTCGDDDLTANPGHFGCSLEPGGDKHFETLLEFTALEDKIKSGLKITSDKIVKVFGLEDNDVPNDENGLEGDKPTGDVKDHNGNKVPYMTWTGSDIDYNDLLILYEGKLQSRKTTTEYKDEDVQKRYMVEDLGYGGNAQTFNASDMDFNDIVVDFISNCSIRETTRYKWENNNWVQDGQATKEILGVNSTTVKVWALGGTLNFELWAGDTKLFTKGGTTASNQTFGTLDAHTMYNTKDPALFPNLGDEYSNKYDKQNPIHVFSDTNKAWDPKTDNVIFKITEQDSEKDFGDNSMNDGGLNSSFLRKTITFPQAGEKNPRIIAVPVGTQWKDERETVTTEWLNSTVQN